MKCAVWILELVTFARDFSIPIPNKTKNSKACLLFGLTRVYFLIRGVSLLCSLIQPRWLQNWCLESSLFEFIFKGCVKLDQPSLLCLTWNVSLSRSYQCLGKFNLTFLTYHFLFLARQCSSRGGELRIDVREDNRVDIAGQAVLVLQGSLCLWQVSCNPNLFDK